MKVSKFTHNNVLPTGLFKNKRGAVETKGALKFGVNGCGLPGCKCSPDYYITKIEPLNEKGQVKGISLIFESKREYVEFTLNPAKMEAFLNFGKVIK